MIARRGTLSKLTDQELEHVTSKTREREAISVKEAGRRGGLTILGTRGRVYLAELGRKGQRAMRLKYAGMASEWGKLGGRPKKPKLCDMGEEANNSRKGGMGPAPH